MNETKKIRRTWMNIRLNEDEIKIIESFFSKSTSRNLSEYARNVLLKKPVYILHRNQSADDFLTEMITLKNELNAIGNNFNQLVKKVHTVNSTGELKYWLQLNETIRESFIEQSKKIQEKLQEIYQLWLQK